MRATEFITEQGVAEGSLNEWQEADLYHVTYIPSMLQMWHNDTMGLGGDVSTTRNYNYALGYLKNFRNSGGVIFTLDQNRLRRDIGRRRMPGTDWFKGEPPADSSDEFRRRDDSLDTDRFETLIKGGLKPFRKYVKKIQIWLPKKRTIKPTPPGEDPLYRHTYTPGDDPDQHYDVSVNDELMQNNWFRNPTMKATWDAVLRDPRTEVKSELGFQKTQHNVPVRARTQYGTDHRLYDPSKDDFREGLKEFAPGGQEGNGPFDYGSAIVQIGEDYTELYNDDGDGADAARIIKVGKTFMDAGMTAGINAFYAMDTMVRDHVAEQLQDLGFNVRQDIYLPYRQGIAKKTADGDAKYAAHQATPAGQEEDRNKAVIKAVIVSGSKNYQPGDEVASLIFDKRKQDVAQRLAEIKKEMLERFGPKVKIDYQVTIGGNPVQVKEQGVAEGQENYNGIDISMEIQKDDEYVDDEDYDNQVLYVTASSKGKELGHVLFAFDGEYLMPQDLEVEERYRGQGIAQTMYDYVKSKGYKIRRSGQQTDAGAGFWDKHKPGKNVWEQGVAEGSDSGTKILYTGKDKGGTVTISYEPDYIPGHSEKYIIRFDGKVKSEMPTLRSAVYGLTHYQFDTFRPNLQPNPKTALEQGVAENFTDGKGPGRPGDSVRHGIPKHATMAELEKASHAKGRKGQLARWQLNMRRGHKK